ncbi:sugar ABC transporter ATP-binding protein [Butyricicoccus faecihominis]|uniref:sugar ABC transporter ATP-binding protein n=1 Tax=Butyricicoccus faecihominis TaxID=1712515 RepID=UPI00247A6182|nr:sugar ABC transporter ATP-binding protein [Butyricicoccus faecihominis]MCQ5128370.1 sugar ABC transporter ATP-binding protein [Butyricicoccus faecihominis]
MNGNRTILELKHIRKEFPGVIALDDISLQFEQGEVHALVGENGAGKSTLIKVLSGAHAPTSGEVCLEGKTYHKLTPQLSQSLGFGVIYQEFTLVPYLAVYENIFLGSELHHGIVIDKRAMIQKARELLDMLGVSIDPEMSVKELSVASMQLVEIAKAVRQNVRFLIMDEPTAPLVQDEVEVLLALVKRLKERGVTIIYISHRLEEVFRISDRVTVLRDGTHVATRQTSEIDRRQLISLMVGRDLSDQFPAHSANPAAAVLQIRKLRTAYLQDIDLEVRSGEILGIAGLIGAGRTELARAVFGADPIISGQLLLNGKEIYIRSPKDAIQNGIALVTEDRKQQGLVLGQSIRENVTLACLKMICSCKNVVIRDKAERKVVDEYIEKLSIKTPGPEQLVRNLSGGNQQKVVLAKWLATEPKVLILDEPTRGIDVGAKQEIYKLMNRLLESGIALVMISSEMPELLGMSDRIVVMHEGSLTGEFLRGEATQDKILECASRDAKQEGSI